MTGLVPRTIKVRSSKKRFFSHRCAMFQSAEPKNDKLGLRSRAQRLGNDQFPVDERTRVRRMANRQQSRA